MFRSEHIFINRLFTSLVLLLTLSLCGVDSEIEILFFSDFSASARSIISPVTWLNNLLGFKSLVPQYNVLWSGLKLQTVGFAWSCMHLTLTELNGHLTRHLWFSFRVSKKPFNFFTMLSPSMDTVSFEVGDDWAPLTLLSVLFFCCCFRYYYCHYYCYYYYYYHHYNYCYFYCQFYYIF